MQTLADNMGNAQGTEGEDVLGAMGAASAAPVDTVKGKKPSLKKRLSRRLSSKKLVSGDSNESRDSVDSQMGVMEDDFGSMMFVKVPSTVGECDVEIAKLQAKILELGKIRSGLKTSHHEREDGDKMGEMKIEATPKRKQRRRASIFTFLKKNTKKEEFDVLENEWEGDEEDLREIWEIMEKGTRKLSSETMRNVLSAGGDFSAAEVEDMLKMGADDEGMISFEGFVRMKVTSEVMEQRKVRKG